MSGLTEQERGWLGDGVEHTVEAQCWRPSCDGSLPWQVERIVVAREERAVEEGLAAAEHLLRKVADYWDGRPLTHHGHHIYDDLLDVLKAITPVTREIGGQS